MSRLGHEFAAGGGHMFGKARVAVDVEAETCIIEVSYGQFKKRTITLRGLDEIRGAYGAAVAAPIQDRSTEDFLRALKFAGQSIAAHQKSKGGRL